MGTRPSYAWQRLMHGRELLKQRLVTSIGPVTKTSVCSDNWILDTIPRPICNVKIVCHDSRDVVVVMNSFSSKWFLARVCFLELVPPCSYQYKKEDATLLRTFSWILWYLWKTQNALVFEQMRYESASALVRAKEDLDMWLSINCSDT
ncbi:hypothetical protein YC2023_090097 [Brassica napus]